MTKSGIVVEIDSRDPTRKKVGTDMCPRKFRKVLEICQRHSTSMISNDTQSQSQNTLNFAVLLIVFICIVVEEIHNFL